MKRSLQTGTTQQKVFTRRLAIVGGFMTAMVGSLVGRLYFLQVIEGQKYRLLSDENRISRRLVPPSRGLITDRFGVPIATNSLSYRAVLVPEQAYDLQRTLAMFGQIVPMSERELERVARGRHTTRAFGRLSLRDDLD
jgi:penicillin-binding protein 2